MGKEVQNNSRRDALKTILRGAGLMGLGGLAWGGMADGHKASELSLRPPGALKEKDFIKACIRCGSCVEACPYNSLILANPDDNTAIGTPYFKARKIPCYMCEDIPCVHECPSGALDKILLSKMGDKGLVMDIKKARMGVAVVDQNNCIAFWGIQCDACYRACPLLGVAITLDFRRNERTGKHAFIEPVVNREVCTGCGMCEHACVTEEPSIVVLPIAVASGKVGEHYVKSWEQKNEKKLNGFDSNIEEVENMAEDVLNDSEFLFDDN